MNKDTKDLLNLSEGFALWIMTLKFIEKHNVDGYIVDSEAKVISLKDTILVVPPELERIVIELLDTAKQRRIENERNSQSTDRNENP